MANARVGLKTRSRTAAGRSSAHILREGTQYPDAKIEVLFKPKEGTYLAPKLSLSADKRRSLQKQIQVYKSRLKKSEPQSPQWHRQTAKIAELQSKLKKGGKDRRNTVHFFELELCLTSTPPKGDIADRYADHVREWIKKEFPDMTPVVGAVHKDQHSLHAHVMFAVPDGSTWTKFVEAKYGDSQIAPALMSQSWHDHIGKSVDLEPLKIGEGKRYVKLQQHKKETGFVRGEAFAEHINEVKDSVESTEMALKPSETEKTPQSMTDDEKTIVEPLSDKKLRIKIRPLGKSSLKNAVEALQTAKKPDTDLK